jgi:hypothetical protein
MNDVEFVNTGLFGLFITAISFVKIRLQLVDGVSCRCYISLPVEKE